MKKALLSIALAMVASFAWGQTTRQPLMKTQDLPQPPPPRTTTTTTTTTEANGTITEYTPGSAIVLRETTGPVRYRFGKTVTYVTRSGRALDEQTVRTKIKVGVPVQVHFTGPVLIEWSIALSWKRTDIQSRLYQSRLLVLTSERNREGAFYFPLRSAPKWSVTLVRFALVQNTCAEMRDQTHFDQARIDFQICRKGPSATEI